MIQIQPNTQSKSVTCLEAMLYQIRSYGKSIQFTEDPNRFVRLAKAFHDLDLRYKLSKDGSYHFTL